MWCPSQPPEVVMGGLTIWQQDRAIEVLNEHLDGDLRRLPILQKSVRYRRVVLYARIQRVVRCSRPALLAP